MMRPIDLTLRLPWPNRRCPFVAFHLAHWGWALGRGRHRQIFVLMFIWGRQFMPGPPPGCRHKSFYPEIPWPR